MASTNATIDGMGFEEINQVGDMPANLWITGSVVADAGLQTAGNISGANILTSIGSFHNINIGSDIYIGGDTTCEGNIYGDTITGDIILNINSTSEEIGELQITGSSTSEATTLVLNNEGASVGPAMVGTISFKNDNFTLNEVTSVLTDDTSDHEFGSLLIGGLVDGEEDVSLFNIRTGVDDGDNYTDYYLISENMKNVELGPDEGEEDKNSELVFTIHGQEGGEASSGAGYSGGNIMLAAGDGSQAEDGDNDGGNAGNVYIYGGEGGAEAGAGAVGAYGKVYAGYNNDGVDTSFIVGSNFFNFSGGEVFINGSVTLTGSYSNSGTQFIEVKNGLIMGIV